MSTEEKPDPKVAAVSGGLTLQAEDAARRAAEAAGLPLSAWISQAIRGAARPEGGAPSPSTPGASTTPPVPSPASDLAALVQRVPVQALAPGRFQTRERVDSAEIDALSESITAHGVLQPLLVRRLADGGFEIIAGERRWRAAQKSGLSEVPAVVLGLSDKDAMEVAIVENLQRQDLSPLEEAEGYRRLLEDFARTQDDVAKAAGKSRSHVANTLRLMKLPDSVKELVTGGELSAGHARALLAAPDPESAARAVVARGLNVRQTEELVQRAAAGEPVRTEPTPRDRDILALEEELTELLGLKCRIAYRNEKGSVTIKFNELSALGQLIGRLQRARAN